MKLVSTHMKSWSNQVAKWEFWTVESPKPKLISSWFSDGLVNSQLPHFQLPRLVGFGNSQSKRKQTIFQYDHGCNPQSKWWCTDDFLITLKVWWKYRPLTLDLQEVLTNATGISLQKLRSSASQSNFSPVFFPIFPNIPSSPRDSTCFHGQLQRPLPLAALSAGRGGQTQEALVQRDVLRPTRHGAGGPSPREDTMFFF